MAAAAGHGLIQMGGASARELALLFAGALAGMTALVFLVVETRPLAVWIAVKHTAPSEGLASTAQGVLWLCTTAAAMEAVRSRDIRTHRLWMARSYALTFTFVLHRFIVELLGLRIPVDAGGTAAFVWMLTVAAVLVPDAIVAFYKPARAPLRTTA
jgi:hypothetical protein